METAVVFNADIRETLAGILNSPVMFIDPEATGANEVPAGAAVELWVDSRNRSRTKCSICQADATLRAASNMVAEHISSPSKPRTE